MTTAAARIRNSKAYHWLDPRNYKGLERTLHSIGLLIMAGLILFSAISPLVDIYVTHKYYSLNSITSGLVGNVSDTLAKQITYDSTKNAYVFNAAGMTPTTQTVGPDKVPLSLLQAKVAGNNSKSKSTYSVVMPTDPKAGIGYYDSNTGLSFQLVPNFTEMSAQQVNNHIVYPTSTNTQLVYSVKNNGLKEDIVLKQYTTDSLAFSYSLKLPKTLEARMLTDGSGSLGIYSADSSLFGSGSSLGNDPAKIESAQLHAQKDHLVFAIPAPVIKQTGKSGQGTATANFVLSNDGSTLTVRADNLRGLHYPITVDPTVVITSTSDFSTGNNEDNNISYPANQINRGSLTGGSISGGWSATTALTTATQSSASVAYNGYVYEIGGWASSAYVATVSYAPINANGTIGSWTATTSLPTATSSATSVAYSGYLYVIGGYNGTSPITTVDYAPINTNGTIGSWTATTALPAATYGATSVVYNGYLYEIGGQNPSTTTTVDYAPINANGTIGAWTATTSLPTATQSASSVVYNGYIYEIGGYTTAATAIVSYTPINANGTIGAWTATTSLLTATSSFNAVVYNGYLYEIGGSTGSATAVVSYAPINANGTIGTWTATASLSTATQALTSVAYNGYIYAIGGFNGAASVATVSYAKIDPAGMTTAYSTTTALPGATSYSTSVAYNGYVYEIGGYFTANVYYAALNANGTIGAWTATTALPTATYDATSVVYNGYVYEIGGFAATATANVYYAPLNANGTIGAWTATTAIPTAVFNATSVVYNGYVYEIGGNNGTSYITTVAYAPLNANGTVGAWTATTVLPLGTAYATSVVHNGYVYEIGGNSGLVTVIYAPLNANGTIGAWTATTSLPTGTYAATSVVYNGYVYEIGGYTTTYVATVYYAPLNANGTIGSWTANTSLPAATTYATSVVYNGYVYEIGGGTGASVTTVYYASINNGGPGTIGAWSATTVLPAAINWATSVAYNGYVYEIGGYNGGVLSTVYYAPINANGTIGSWNATTPLPSATYYASSVVYNGYVYEIGGDNGSTAINTVLFAPINSDGTLGAWVPTTVLPTANNRSTSVAYKGYIYEVGGYDGAANTATVLYAPIYSNGTLGSWTATTSLSTATRFTTSVAYNGYLYEIGGYTSAPISTVMYAPINSNGTIGSWTATSYLPIATSVATTVAYNGYLYEIGGDNPSVTTTVDYAPINANGTIGAWTATTSLPAVTDHATSIVYNGYIYEIGGYNGSANVNTVDYAPLNVMPRVGHYSQQFNFGTQIAPMSITYNGSLPNINGLSSIQYKTADSSGVFGVSDYSTGLVGSTADCVVAGTAQYVSVSIALDDSNSASFPDVNATSSNVTDFTITATSYHPSPSVRLRGGKFFSLGSLQALDTCGSYTSVAGGTLSSDATYFYRTFTSSGTLTISGAPLTVDYLVVGGGGGGGHNVAGGGGGGGLRTGTGYSVAPGTYSVTVGAGGVAAIGGSYGQTPNNLSVGGNGGNSVFASITADGGGGGGTSGVVGANGGSGGGGGNGVGPGSGNIGGFNPVEGFAGSSYNYRGSGGGGATAVGSLTANVSDGGSNGGAGATSSMSGSSVSYSGGGGGGGYGNTYNVNGLGGVGGIGGGGRGGQYPSNTMIEVNGVSGAVNTGGGGGGGGAGDGSGGMGGSGIVIIRYLRTAVRLPVVTGGTLTSDGTYYYRTFLNSGQLKITDAPLTADVMVVGGGGSGGWPYSGGGGAGGFVVNNSVSLSASIHTVTVGAGGVGGYNLGNGQKGGSSSLDSIIATGGGGGVGDSSVTSAQNGASGGGGADIGRNPSGNNGGTGIGGQGFAGGKGSPTSSTQASGGGGGGAGAVGTNATTTYAGSGGIGLLSSWPSPFTSSVNYLNNGNMENWTAGTSVVPDYWTDPGSVTISRDSTTVKEGSYSLKAVWGNFYPQFTQNIDFSNHPERLGKTYTASAWIYDTTGTGNSSALNVYGGTGYYSRKGHSSAIGWELVKETFYLPISATQFTVSIGISSGTIYIDDVQVHDYVPGTGEWGYFAGGGGGGTNGADPCGAVICTNLGGLGGGGHGASNDGSKQADAGLANTGGGSGGGGAGNAPNSPKSGGSGIVIIRYLMSSVATPAATSEKTPTVEYLVVGGGGGGGGGGGAGGGGGGLRTASSYTVTPGTAYTVTVGAGGAPGTAGSASVFNNIIAAGGGFGGGNVAGYNGGSGGSGGGSSGSFAANIIGSGNIPKTSPSQGFNGGAGCVQAGGQDGQNGGGGGGAGAVGFACPSHYSAGNGGSGMTSSIGGSYATYAGGGGGARNASTPASGVDGAGGNGGGGAGVQSGNGIAGTANTGGGGGGSGNSVVGNSGGSGIVIIRYPNAYMDAASTTGSPTYTNTGGFKIYIFKSSGSITF